MKKKIFTLFLVILFHSLCLQTYAVPEKMQEVMPSESKDQDLALLCRIWGFLKYRHPAVQQGSKDWDEELVKMLPGYRNTKTREERNRYLERWIASLGPLPAAVHKDSVIRDLKLSPDTRWIRKSRLSPPLAKMLAEMNEERVPAKQQYVEVQTDDGVNYPMLVHEKNYTESKNISQELKLLAVFKFWNFVEYWYPYKYLIRPDWDVLLKDFITCCLQADSDEKYTQLIQKMAASIKDTHSSVLGSQIETANGLWELPLRVKLIQGQAVVYFKDPKVAGNPVEPGFLITRVNGRAIADIIRPKLPYISASNDAALMREAAKLISRCSDTVAKVEFSDKSGRLHTAELKCKKYNSLITRNVYDFPYQKDSTYFLRKDSILYVNTGKLKRSQIPALKPYLKYVKGIIFDNRLYPNEPAGDLLSQLLLPAKTALVKFSQPVKGYPGYFNFSAPMIIGSDNPEYYRGPVITLVNEETQSTGEFITMSFKLSPNSIVVGSTTAGADGNVSTPISLPGRFFTQITVLGVYYPDGGETQRIGIVPDVFVGQTVKGLQEGRDELLDKAVALIHGENRKN